MNEAIALPVDSAQLRIWLDALARISEAPPPAVTRVLYSDTDLAARAWLWARFVEEGLEVRDDAVGNIFARWRGADDDAPAVATGSHIDAIPNAGRFDGTVGVLGALTAIRALRVADFRPARSLELVVFTAEEPTRFGIGCLGSRLLSGALAPERAAALTDTDGRSLAQWQVRYDVAAEKSGWLKGPELAARRHAGRTLTSVRLPANHYHAFVELHIEQGPLLERDRIPIGIVEAIAGPGSYRVWLTGEGGHAGAVLMPDRHDAGLAGAEIALAVERAARSTGSPDTVGTTGVFRQWPNAINSIPCDVTLEIDLRDTKLEARAAAWAEIEAAIAEICTRRGVRWTMETMNADPPAACAPALVEAVARLCETLSIGAKRMVSRAYHDSLFMAQICPTVMIFVPSRDGVSHRPDEYTSPVQLAAGVNVLGNVLARLCGAQA